MANLNSSLVSDYQTKTLEQRINDNINSVDLNYLGFDAKTDVSIEKYKIQSHINRVLLWLASKPYDYVRESLKGGVLYSLLGKLSNEDTASEWEQDIRSRFNDEFYQELSLIYIKVDLDKVNKKATITMIVQDNINKKTFSVNTEAEA